MREIVTVEQVERLFVLLALCLPVLGALAGVISGARRGQGGRGALTGFGLGLIGPLNYALWRLYNGTTDALGMDTVRNLVVNLAVFIILGALAGVAVGLTLRRRQAAQPVEEPRKDA